jgi:hypothetical protein
MSAAAMQRANTVTSAIYQRFLQDVLDAYVLKERSGSPLGEKQKQACQEGREIDPRTLYLMSISGKGGWHDDPDKWERYRHCLNITLLDHLLSVVRGAMVLAALDWLLDNPEMDETELRQRLTVIAAIGFLHDLDKMLKLPRDESLTLEHIRIAVERYGITAFLTVEGVELSDEQIRFLIEQAEDSQRYRHPVVIPPHRAWKHAVERYVKLADKLDGLWQQHGANGGLEAIIQRLQQEQSLSSPLLAQWEAIDIFDPHHPFLLDELQRRLSFACQHPRFAGIPPLLETHQDGRLFMLMPKEQAEAIKQDGLRRLVSNLPFKLEISISNRGLPELMNGQPDHAGLREFLQAGRQRKTLGQLFRIRNDLVQQVTKPLDECLGKLGLAPRWPKATGQTSTPYPDPDALDVFAELHFLRAAHLALLLNLKLPVNKKNGLPDYAERENQLLAVVAHELPKWLAAIDDDQSRRILLSLWVTSLGENAEIAAGVWGEAGLLRRWLEGNDETLGFNRFFAGEAVVIQQAIGRHFSQLMKKQRVFPLDETCEGRCLFTDEPSNTLMASNLGLYEVKVSAFTGREGKPDSLTAPAKGEVPIGYVSLAEHKLRSEVYNIQGGKPSGVPTLLSSPVTTGLFGALILNNEQQFPALSVYDLSRQKVEKDKVNYRGLEAYRDRYRIARLERIPENTEDQINLIRLLLTACLRIGRPIHVFKGLPTPQKAFFYFDAMPSVLKQLLGDQALRLEQIPVAIGRLNMAQTLASTPGLGYDVLGLYAMQRTRFQAICLAWCHAREALKQPNHQKAAAMQQLAARLSQEFHDSLQRRNFMSKSDGALVRLGHAAARIQQRPFGQSSTNEEMLVFNLCLQSALDLRGAGQADTATLIHGIAGELETNLVRKGKAAARKHRGDQSLEAACMDFARQYVTEVWQGVLHGKPPAQKTRRMLGSVYRMAFLQSFRDSLSQTDTNVSVTTQG